MKLLLLFFVPVFLCLFYNSVRNIVVNICNILHYHHFGDCMCVCLYEQVNQKKIPPTTFVDITAMHGNFCTKFYTIVKRSNIHFITKFY